jgi:DNA-binding response OmpR family regulator
VTSSRSPATPTCLIVEDEPLIARALGRALLAMGVHYSCASSLAEVAGFEGPFDGAIVDLDLPDGSGLNVETLLPEQAIRSSVVFFSATTDSSAQLEAARRGVFVPKADGTKQALRALAGQLARPRQGVGSGTYAVISGLPLDAQDERRSDRV